MRFYAVDTGYGAEAGEGVGVGVGGVRRLNAVSELPEPAGAMMFMDVIEHVPDDAAFLREALGKAAPGAPVVVTVPAFQALFSGHDAFLKHYRRYGRKQLLALLRGAGLRVERCHYFYASLFWARLLSLPLEKMRPPRPQTGIGAWRFGEAHVLTRAVRAALDTDFALCAALAKLKIYPPGLSLLAVCRKM